MNSLKIANGRVFSAGVLAAFLCWPLFQTARAQKEGPQTNKAENGNAPGASFTIRTKERKAQYKPGELITIEMLFMSSIGNTYKLDARNYDRSGHLEADEYHVDPDVGTSEPLRDYLQNGLFGGSMGGLVPSLPPLAGKPYIIAQDLNEFVRFDRPGKYHLYITNSRVGKLDPQQPYRVISPIRLTSNTIELEILPADREWQARQLRETLGIIDSDETGDRRASCRTLRFLNTEDAEAAMISRYLGSTDGCDGEFHFGLLSSPRRQSIIAQMEARIVAPDHPVTGSFVHTLATLAYLEQFLAPMPPYSEVQGNEEKVKQWQAEMQNRRSGFQAIIMKIAEQLSAAVSRKQQSARAVSVDTLLQLEENIPKEKRTAASGTRAKRTSAELTSLFLDLPSNTQYRLLTFSWKNIASPAMQAALRSLIEKPSYSPRDGTFNDVIGVALLRLYELAPEEGRNAIIKEMRRTPLRVRASVLTILPADSFPGFDDLLAEKLASQGVDQQYEIISDNALLIARYATSGSLSSVRKVLGDRIGKSACMAQTPLLAYFLRVDPALGAEMLDDALSSRKETRCFESELGAVAELYMSREIVQAAINHLDDPDMTVSIQAATVISKHGTADEEQLLWNRLERWHNEWLGRDPMELQAIKKGVDDFPLRPAQTETELVRAIAGGLGWLMDDVKFKRLKQLTLTQQTLQEISSMMRRSEEREIGTSVNYNDGSRYFRVAQYEVHSLADFKEKLTQFPKGTTFTGRSDCEDPSDEGVFIDLSQFLEQHGMRLARSERER